MITTTSKTAIKEVMSRGIRSTTAQQPQTAHEGESVFYQDLVRRIEALEEHMRALKRETTILEPQREPEDPSATARWQTINLVIHGMFILLAFEARLLLNEL